MKILIHSKSYRTKYISYGILLISIIKFDDFRSINDRDSIQLDRSTEAALLWSSGGIKSILLNQWKSTVNENENVLINTFTSKNSFFFLFIIILIMKFI